jgi:chromate transporter
LASRPDKISGPFVTPKAKVTPARISRVVCSFTRAPRIAKSTAYAVLAYMAQQAVETYGWLRPGEMLDGLGMAETTPGPLITVVQFVGFLAAFRRPGALPPMLAGLLATWCTFVPCFLRIGIGAPFIERLRDNKPLNGALAGITAAVVGVILNLAIWFALHTWFHEVRHLRGLGLSFDVPVLSSIDPWALLLSAVAMVAIFRFKAGMIQTLLPCSAVGIVPLFSRERSNDVRRPLRARSFYRAAGVCGRRVGAGEWADGRVDLSRLKTAQ